MKLFNNFQLNRKLGVLILDRKYRLVKGNPALKNSYDFRVIIKKIKGLYNPPSPPIYINGKLNEDVDKFIKAAIELQVIGVSAIVASCGFFSLLQAEASSKLKIPIYTSPILLIPLVQMILQKDKKVGLLTLFKEYLTREYFSPISNIDMSRVILSDLSNAIEFRRMINEDASTVDEKKLEKEVIDSAKRMIADNPDIKSIIVECSDMVPYSKKIRSEIDLPVYDYNNLIRLAFTSNILL